MNNKYINHLNGIYEMLIIFSLLVVFVLSLHIAGEFGPWSKEQIISTSAFAILLFHYIAVKISRADIQKALEKQKEQDKNGTTETKVV